MRSVTECPLILPLTQQQPGPVDRETGELQLLGRHLHLDSIFANQQNKKQQPTLPLVLGYSSQEPGLLPWLVSRCSSRVPASFSSRAADNT